MWALKYHISYIFLYFLIFACQCYAVPAKKIPFYVNQSDGTTLTIMLVGDENFHFYCTEDGIPVIKSIDNNYYYADYIGNEIVCGKFLAHNSNERIENEIDYISFSKEHLNYLIKNKWEKTFVKSQKRVNDLIVTHKKNAPQYIGKKKGLVLLVEFDNVSMIGDSPASDYYKMFNQIGYSKDNHIGSVHDYFYDQSYGLFDLSFDVVGPIKLSKKYGYYGQNSDAFGADKYAGTMVIEACNAADETINFKEYDWDGDGIVETVFVVYAGYGENASSDASTIWPHKSSLSGRATVGDGNGFISLDGVIIDVYACSSELAGAEDYNKNGIGTACHEFSHCLGLPDLYDTDYSGAFGMNKWDLMDAGSYSGPNGRGEIPYGYSAFERAFVGWLEFEKLENESWYALQPLNDCAHAYIINNDANENEFFILENHQSNKWFSYVGNHTDIHGMMITHVDYDEISWARNTVNGSRLHMRESIVPADNSYGTYYASDKSYYLTEAEYKGDLFPGSKHTNRFSPKSHENCGGKLFNRNIDGSYDLSMTIDNITEDNGIISFSVGNNLKTPRNVKASQNAEKLTLQWEEVGGADKYIIEVSSIISYLPSKIENEVIEDVVGTSCSLDYLACKQCSVRVKAKNEFVTSEWSEYVKYINDPDGINNIENDNSIHREYYNINGTEALMPKPKGIYIQKENNKTKKIYIR